MDDWRVPYVPYNNDPNKFMGFSGIWDIQSAVERQDKYQSWRWDTKANRYRDTDTGKFISRDKVLSFVSQSVKASFSSVENLATWVSEGTLSVNDWSIAFRNEIKAEYIRQYLSGIGGRQMMKAADWGSIGGMVKEQYKYLDGFASDIATGNLSEGQIRARMQMYINSAREAHEKAHAKIARKWGADEVGWVVLPGDNCDTCIDRSSQGWKPIGVRGGFPDPLAPAGEAFPGDGSSSCLTNCHCSLSYRNSVTGEEFEG